MAGNPLKPSATNATVARPKWLKYLNVPPQTPRLKSKSPHYDLAHNHRNVLKVSVMAHSSFFTTLQTIFGRKPKVPPRPATAPWRPYANTGTDLSRNDAWRTLKLRKRRMTVDGEGRWWLVEERQCLYTGAIFKRTRRITE